MFSETATLSQPERCEWCGRKDPELRDQIVGGGYMVVGSCCTKEAK